jgi:Fe-S-cluster containining protein
VNRIPTIRRRTVFASTRLSAPRSDERPSPHQKLNPLNQAMAFDVRYDCQRCTACCRWPGQVKVGNAEIRAMAALLNLESWDFIQQYTRLRPQRDGLALLDKPNGECIFLEGRDCRVQEAKPVQCRGFPNTWNFPGWRSVCEAVPRLKAGADPALEADA